ncbi:MAG: formylglycine-generating enzyme family protein [Prochlorothrix sp.]
MDLVEIPAGEFWMGSEEGDKDERSRYQVNDEWPRHQVNVPQFWMGWYPVTQAQWRSVAENLPQIDHELALNPSRFKSDNRPVEKVSWYDAQEFCRRLSQYCGETFALPTEAEWEYAARAGTKTAYHFGDEITPDLANYGQKIGQTTPVDQYHLVNRFGLYDIHGNVWEWCQDEYHESYTEKPDDSKRDGSIAWADSFDVLGGDLSGVMRTLRGGSWNDVPEYCWSAVRGNIVPGACNHYSGFRVVCRRCGLKTP